MGDVSLLAPIETVEPAPVVIDAEARALIKAIDKRLKSFETALRRVSRTQTKNLPLFEDMLTRVASMRESIHAQANGLSRVEKLATDAATVTGALSESVRALTSSVAIIQTHQETNGAKLDDLVQLFTHARTFTGWIGKHKSAIGTFVLGIAITRGWITAENGKNFLSIFGM